MDTLVDSNVIIDVLSTDSAWREWSAAHLQMQADLGSLVINPLIYAEVSLSFRDQATLDEALSAQQFRRDALPWSAAFSAARAYLQYRIRGGQKTSPLPDFYIGAHAAVSGFSLLTRDSSRYRACFPALKLITP